MILIYLQLFLFFVRELCFCKCICFFNEYANKKIRDKRSGRIQVLDMHMISIVTESRNIAVSSNHLIQCSYFFFNSTSIFIYYLSLLCLFETLNNFLHLKSSINVWVPSSVSKTQKIIYSNLEQMIWKCKLSVNPGYR